MNRPTEELEICRDKAQLLQRIPSEYVYATLNWVKEIEAKVKELEAENSEFRVVVEVIRDRLIKVDALNGYALECADDTLALNPQEDQT